MLLVQCMADEQIKPRHTSAREKLTRVMSESPAREELGAQNGGVLSDKDISHINFFIIIS